MSITLFITVAVATILAFTFGIFVGIKKATNEIQERLAKAWRKLYWTEKDLKKLVHEFNKTKK